MSLPEDLLAQAAHLAEHEKNRPKQASLRRAVSAAYYALFHLLTRDAARLLSTDVRVIVVVGRAYGHREMNEVSKAVAKGDFPKPLLPLKPFFPISSRLRSVATAFVDLQQARHQADYDLARRFTRKEARLLIAQARQAFLDWRAIRQDETSRLYLASFLL